MTRKLRNLAILGTFVGALALPSLALASETWCQGDPTITTPAGVTVSWTIPASSAANGEAHIPSEPGR